VKKEVLSEYDLVAREWMKTLRSLRFLERKMRVLEEKMEVSE